MAFSKKAFFILAYSELDWIGGLSGVAAVQTNKQTSLQEKTTTLFTEAIRKACWRSGADTSPSVFFWVLKQAHFYPGRLLKVGNGSGQFLGSYVINRVAPPA